jgi:hypothetical protein
MARAFGAADPAIAGIDTSEDSMNALALSPRRRGRASLASLLALALPAPATLAAGGYGEFAPPLPPFTLETVLTDVAPDGRVDAMGTHWKMHVGAGGAEFIAIAGEAAPRNLPLRFLPPRFTVGGIGVEPRTGNDRPRLDADRVEVDRGTLIERYDFSLEHVEQSFVIASLPARGELVLEIPLATELEYRGRDQGLLFRADGLFDVRYGDAAIFDAAGREVRVLSEFRGDAIEIRVPAAFVEQAKLPLVIDPIIFPTIAIDASGTAATDPDVAYDATFDVFLVIYEKTVSSSDHDILSRRMTPAGSVIDSVAVDLASNDSTDPSCANNGSADQFLLVWRHAPLGIFDEIEIRGRLRNAGNATQSASFEITDGRDNESNPVVGGTSVGPNYLVAWQENPAFGADGENVAARTVTTGGSLNALVVLATSFADEQKPAVNKHTFGDEWMVVWERETNDGDSDLHGAICGATSGFSVIDDDVVAIANTDDTDPVVAAVEDDEFVLFWTRPVFGDDGAERDLMMSRFRHGASAILGDSGVFNLTELEDPGSTESLTQRATGAIRDGQRLLCVYNGILGTNSRVLSISFRDEGVFSPIPVILETAHVLGGQPELGGPIVSRFASGGPLGRSLVVTQETDDSTSDVRAQFFDSLTPGGISIVQTGCGGFFEPSLTASGSGAVCEDVQITLSGFDQALLIVGAPAAIPLCPNQGGCVLGATPTLVLPATNGSFTAEIPCTPSLFAATVAITGVELVTGVIATGTCGPPAVAQRIRTSDTVLIDFR